MTLFPKFDVCCPTCHTCKINRTIPAQGGLERTKNSVKLGLNLIKIAPLLASKAPVLDCPPTGSGKHLITTRSRDFSPKLHAQVIPSSAHIDFQTYLSMVVHQNLVAPSSLLKSRLKYTFR